VATTTVLFLTGRRSSRAIWKKNQGNRNKTSGEQRKKEGRMGKATVHLGFGGE